MRRDWWARRSHTDPEPVTHGTPDGGKILIVTMRDSDGEPVERAWVLPEHAPQWDHRIWGGPPST